VQNGKKKTEKRLFCLRVTSVQSKHERQMIILITTALKIVKNSRHSTECKPTSSLPQFATLDCCTTLIINPLWPH